MDRKLLLLGLLREHAMHGYGLVEFIDQALATCTDMKRATAYYLLNQMAEDGWIVETEMQEGNRPARRVFNLSDKGETIYQEMLRENLSSYTQPYFPSDIGLAFLDSLPAPEALRLLEQRVQGLESMLQAVQAAPTHPGSLQLVIEHQRRHLRAELAWLEEVMQNLV